VTKKKNAGEVLGLFVKLEIVISNVEVSLARTLDRTSGSKNGHNNNILVL